MIHLLLTAKSENEIDLFFDKIQTAEENTSDWISFYQQKWVIGSLNKNMSKIDNEIWINAPNSTNAAEAAHALSNRGGKNLKLVTTIFQGRKLDKVRFTTIHVHKKFNVPNQGHDKSLIACNIHKKTTKVITIHSDSDSEDDCNENTEDNKENIHNNLNFKELEYREKDLALREWEAKVRLMEL
ncbi:hypothetical protein GLOIN_2v1789505 [Rhizophagus irregularis DAOM 181602=DAOM 197198]|nr:hypothetical protein GLOIN_2v1789505 [Rhizophagus irregularis DAOM 181602=DAOM 197198]